MYFTVKDPRAFHTSLNGWFDGLCPSNGIADKMNKKAKGVWAQQEEYKKKLNSLKNGAQAAEWENLKKQVRKLDDDLKNYQRDLEKELAIASAIGVDTTGLGAWCNGAVSKRKKAEASLREAEKALGEVKGAMQTLERQQNDGIKEAGLVIQQNQQRIEAVKNKIRAVQTKIEVFKAKRDNAQQEITSGAGKSNAKKSDLIGQVKENAPLIIGGLVAVGTGVYLYNNRKKPKRVAKKVQA